MERVRSSAVGDLLGGLFVAAAALLFGAVVIFGKLASGTGIPVPSMLAVRFGLAGLILAAVLLAARATVRPAPGEGRRLLLLGGIGYAAESALFFFGLRHGTAAAVTLLFFTYPVIVALLSAALGMGLPGRLVATSLVAAMAGAGLVVGTSGGLDIAPAGIAFALGSAMTFSVYLVGAELALRRTSSPVAAMWVALAASAGLALFAAATGQARLPEGAREWLPVVGMGTFTAGAFFCLFAGLRRLGAVRTAIVAALEPVSTAVLALVFLGEAIRAGTAAGGALILVASVVASVARRRPVEPEAPVP